MDKFSNKVLIKKLKRIPVVGGDIIKIVSKNDEAYEGFGETYFSLINNNSIKCWKRHSKVTSNIVVPFGKVRFVFFDGDKSFHEVILDDKCSTKLTIKPGIWFGFQGLNSPHSIVMNLIDSVHDPKESEKMKKEDLNFNW